MGLIVKLFKSLSRGFLKDVLAGAGLAMATSGSFMLIFNKLVDHLKDASTGMPPLALSFAHMLGLDVGISLLIGAIISKHAVNSASVFLTKKKSK